ncbi:hypothetical protein BD410DRAFT_775301 [Rickenella mellea]|uniref:Protein kinase domain-containing protein n=1 Tax=Rickenella mellea TaxID=50990 RepID=A0A4Y7PSL6_9AGAM|nr:hypothetical protein BD410DRAFT_775301 [Rickenella mellea]
MSRLDDTSNHNEVLKERALDIPHLSDYRLQLPPHEDPFIKRLSKYYATGSVSELDDEKEEDSSKEIAASKRPKTRFIFRQWPRNPAGYVIDNIPDGKMALNISNKLWGASLYDFYRVRRIPDCPNLSTISTGSKLAAWAKANNELEWAKDEIKCSELETNPRETKPMSITTLIEASEIFARAGLWGKSVRLNNENTWMDEYRELYSKGQFLCDPDHFPAPWPLKPFSMPLYRLQRRIPFELLPEKLVVHDPWNLLEVTEYEPYYESREGVTYPRKKKAKWGQMSDVVVNYKLQLSADAKKEREKREQKRQNVNGPGSLAIYKRDMSSSPEWQKKFGEEDTISVPLPPRPDPEPAKVAHLYIVPSRRIGRGNHSVVYQAEWEVPRSMLVDPKMCTTCGSETLVGPDDLMDCDGGDQARGSTPWKQSDEDGVNPWNLPETRWITRADGSVNKFSGMPRLGSANLQWQDKTNVPYCKHMDNGPTPPSAKVSVAVKLSVPDDNHLAREARIYQSLPPHLFEHWNGFNIVPPLTDPVPLGAVLPQFYGYYVPEEEKNEHLSPIMLLEHCGIGIDPNELNIDDKQECYSLLRRLHFEQITHNSAFHRNIVMQNGPLQEPPNRRTKDNPQFRLLDLSRVTLNSKEWDRDIIQEEFQTWNDLGLPGLGFG